MQHFRPLGSVRRRLALVHRFVSGLFDRLCDDSIIHRTVGRVRIAGRFIFDDRVEPLRQSPLAMFFYNLRIIFFICGAAFLAIAFFAQASYPVDDGRSFLVVLALAWVIPSVASLVFHTSFRTSLSVWRPIHATADLPPRFTRVLAIDFAAVYLMAFDGKYWLLRP